MLRKGHNLPVICASYLRGGVEACILRMRRVAALAWFATAACGLILGGNLSAATVPPGFTETVISGPWTNAVGVAFEDNGRMYVWEGSGQLWFKDPGDANYTLLLDIHDEVGKWGDHGMLGFALDPDFRDNGYIYVLYVVDRYYLFHSGDPDYDPNVNEYNAATIGRLTRYTCRSADGFRSVDPTSRQILIGETRQTGIPICSTTHGVGSLVFGEDGTLLLSCGDGASYQVADTGGVQTGSYAPQALADGIIRPKEDVGAFRAQLVDSLNGKVLRIDPATGNGLPSNPYYDAANPRSARSRVWALGLRNPFRMSLQPNTGSHFPPDGNPGILYIGHVGYNTWEALDVVTGAKQNFGWPTYEGLSINPDSGYDVDIANQDALNPLYPAAGCTQYFSFRQLLHEDTLNPAGQPPFANPCNASQSIPSSIPQFLHTRPVLDWNHSSAITRTPIYGPSGDAQIANVGDPGSPVSGTPFRGNCAIGGTWYTGTNFPAAYQNLYYFADWGQGLINTLTFDANNKPVALGSFATNGGAVVDMVQHPVDGTLYYITYDYNGGALKQLSYTGNRTPIAVASADRYYGTTPLAVQLSSNGSYDPDGQQITYSWNFGDGSPVSTQANPAHNFTAPPGVPTEYVVTLTVTDTGNLSAQTTLIISVNNTPPNVTITSPVDHALYSPFNQTTINLTATVNDAESGDAQLSYQWQVLLHHNDHNHLVYSDTNHSTTAVLDPTGCDGINIYYYRVLLTVTDPQGLATTREVRLYPDCGPDTPPTISNIPNQTIPQNGSTGPIPFTVGDAQVAPANLQLSGASSNLGLVPNGNIVFGGSGANRTVTVTPAAGQTGSTTITVTVNDGPNNTSTSFVVTVNAPTPTPTPTPSNASCQRSLTIDHTKVPSTQSNFTVLVSLTDPALKTVANGGHVVNANGYDIGFYSDSGGTIKLKWEVERYDGTTGNLIAWVKIPSVSSSSDTVFYLMYGDSSINTDQSDPPNTWDSNFKGVWHMSDSAANTTIRESTVTGANGTNNANTSTKTATGEIGKALSYNGSTDGSFAAINLSATNIATLSFWMQWTTNANDDDLAFEYTPNYNSNAGGFIADWNSSGFGGGRFETGMGKGDHTYWSDLFARPSAGTWHLIHLVFNRSGSANKAYVDGSLQTLTTATHTASSMGNFSNSSLYFMSRAASSLNAAGTLDEVRLSTIERSASWTATEYNNQSSPGTFITMGNETCATPTPTPTPTATPIATPTPTPPPPTPTPTPPTPTPTATPTVTPTPTPTSTSTPTPTPTPRPGLVAAYGFNEGSGTVVTDVSGNGNNGTISGATWTTSGKYGNALIFNGTNALVTINNAASLQLTSGMTLEAWVYPTTVSNKSRDVIYKGNDNYYLEGSTNNSRRPALGGTFGSPIYGTAALTANTWTHLAGTYDGATMSLYINGVQVTSRAQTGAIATSTNPLQIGGDSIYGQYFAGRIDEVRVYNRALGAAEIQSDMNTLLIAASDDFNRTDGGLGLNWAKPLPASEQTLVIVNNKVTPDIEQAHCYAYWVGNTFSQDQYSQVRISNVGAWNGVIARAQPIIDRFYMAFVFGANDYRIFLRKDGLYYTLSTGNTETWVAGDIIRLEASGSNPVQLTLLRNGNPVLTYTDTTQNLVGGSPGIGIYSSPPGDHLAIDEWEGGILGMQGILVPQSQAPSARGNLVATALDVSEVKLSWTASTDNGGVTEYEVERQDPGRTSFVHLGTTIGTSYYDTGLEAGSSYSYRVLVRDAKGSLNEYSEVVSVTTASPTINPRRSR